MVLSSIHTGDAAGAVARLADLGVPAFATAAALSGVLAQRLLRRVCDQCAKPCEPNPATLRRLAAVAGPGTQPVGYRLGAGCVRCGSTGFRGRVGVYELLEVTEHVREAVAAGAESGSVRGIALREGMRPMWRDGIEKAQLGLTTLEEVVRLAAASLDRDTANTVVRLSA
jgi:type II secretory ATPase GspE/PulE/Tfp pilus assembly ATPase PilB-like protein